MTGPITTVDEVLAFIGRVDEQAIRWEQKKLAGIRAWAMAQLGVDYAVGDRVEIARQVVSLSSTPGWWHYREALAPGATAVVQEIDFNDYAGVWMAAIRLDREWSVSDSGRVGSGQYTRYWNGPAGETPEGMRPPSTFDRERHPEGRRHTFCLRAENLRKHVEPDPEPCASCGRDREET